MANEPEKGLSTRALRLGFFVVLFLLTSAAVFSLISARRADEQIDRVVATSLERERLIGVMRLDARMLIEDAQDHLDASSDADRTDAERAMSVTLRDLEDLSAQYTTQLPSGEVALWQQLSATAQRLVKTVEKTIKASRRAEAERARQHLEEEAKPISYELDDTANQLARRNASDTRAVLEDLQSMRLRTSLLAGAAVLLALVLSLVVAFQVTRTLNRQSATIDAQLTELSARNEELDAFASRVAHDLVSPLSPLKGYLTLARRQVDGDVKDLLVQAESSTARMSELVDGLLRFCRAGKSTDRTPGELDTAVSAILLEQSQAASAAGVQLERALEASVLVQCPTTLLQAIAANLVGNAVKYTAGTAGARVDVSVRREGSFGIFEVADNGPGLSPASVAQLFQPFFRAPETRSTPGTGLGLATSKRLIEAHGGVISLTTAPQQGLRMTVRLPLASR